MQLRKHLRKIRTLDAARDWENKYRAIEDLLAEHRQEFWVGEDPRNPDLLLISRRRKAGGGWAVHIPRREAKRWGLVGDFDDPLLLPRR